MEIIVGVCFLAKATNYLVVCSPIQIFITAFDLEHDLTFADCVYLNKNDGVAIRLSFSVNAGVSGLAKSKPKTFNLANLGSNLRVLELHNVAFL